MPSQIIIIAAITMNGYIARHSHEIISWSKDLPLFKKQTLGHPIIMGSNTKKTILNDLKGREIIVFHRSDKPKEILDKINGDICFVVGGGKTNAIFYQYATHLYITPHHLIFNKGIPLFDGEINEKKFKLINTIPYLPNEGIFQYQYKII
tara:strand:+ start:3993 stop:4442 length:450 start_codon:yes stop_codon:yes gene_type:complete